MTFSYYIGIFLKNILTMKKYLLIACIGMSAALQAQGISDAMRYAQENIHGTARFSAMSGAFGAVGGDFSAINVNPAGSSIFADNQVGATLSLLSTKNKAGYFGTDVSDSNIAFDLNQAGAVFIFNTNSEKTKWKKFALSINYDNANNFANSTIVAGTNTNNSIGDYFTSYANQVGLSANFLGNAYFDELSLRERQAFLGYDTNVISSIGGNANSTSYISNVPRGNYYQDMYTETSGYNGKLSFNASAAYNDRFYFGLNLNTYFNDYTKISSFYEENNNPEIAGRPTVRSVTFNNDVHTYGNGFSFQLGAIAKVTQSFRVGLAYESPTWYTLNDEVAQIVYSDGVNYPGGVNSDASNSNVIILYDPYELKTPGKYTGSLAYVFGKHGLLSVDYSMKDYGNTKFRPSDSYFDPINNQMSNTLNMAGELRIGGEYRIKNWSLRGGFRYEESPYKNANTIGDLTGFSGGFGYQFTRTRLDLSYSHAQRDTQQGLFSQGLVDPVMMKTQTNNFSLGLVFIL